MEISLEIVVGRDFFWTFWVEMPPQILFGRVFFAFGWLRSLLRYLGRMLVSNVFGSGFVTAPTIIAFREKPANTYRGSIISCH